MSDMKVTTAEKTIYAWKMAIYEASTGPEIIVIECRLPAGTRYISDFGDVKSDRQEFVRAGRWDKEGNFIEVHISGVLRSGLMHDTCDPPALQTTYELGTTMFDNYLKDEPDDSLRWKGNRGLWACTNPEISQRTINMCFE